MSTLTSANAILTIVVNGLFPSPQTIQGFEVDDAFDTSPVDQIETRMGVDGYLSAGKIFMPYPMTIHLMPTSPSVDMFDIWWTTQNAIYDVFSADGSIEIPGVHRSYTLQNGYLKSITSFPSSKKTLAPLVYEMVWERMIPELTA